MLKFSDLVKDELLDVAKSKKTGKFIDLELCNKDEDYEFRTFIKYG